MPVKLSKICQKIKMANKNSNQTDFENKMRLSIEGNFTKNAKNLSVFSNEQLKNEVHLMLELLRRYSLELSYYQLNYSIAPEIIQNLSEKIDINSVHVDTQDIENFIKIVDTESIDIFFNLFKEYDMRIKYQNDKIESYKKRTNFFEEKFQNMNEKIEKLQKLYLSKHDELISIYKKGIVDECTQNLFLDLEKNEIKNFVKIIEQENCEMLESYANYQTKILFLEKKINIQEEIVLNETKKMQNYLEKLNDLKEEKIITRTKLNESIEQLGETKLDIENCKSEMRKKDIELENKIKIIDEKNKELIKLKNEKEINKLNNEKRQKLDSSRDLLLEMETLKALNTNLQENLEKLLSENFRFQKKEEEIRVKNAELNELIPDLESKIESGEILRKSLEDNLKIYQNFDLKNGDCPIKLSEVQEKMSKDIENHFSEKTRLLNDFKINSKVKIEKLKQNFGKEIADLKRKIQVEQSEKELINLNVNELKEEIQKSKTENDFGENLEKIVAQKDKIIEELNDQVRDLNRKHIEYERKV